MTEDNARDMVVRQWLALPPQDRATDEQAAAFSVQMQDRYQFTSKRDRRGIIAGWLLPYVGRPNS